MHSVILLLKWQQTQINLHTQTHTHALVRMRTELRSLRVSRKNV